jgi:dolichol-phosphate mannosyltransferase
MDVRAGPQQIRRASDVSEARRTGVFLDDDAAVAKPDQPARSGVVVLPTYNEALNLPTLIPRILNVDPAIDVLVVDDGSPDGTGDLAEQLSKQLAPRVTVLHRSSKSGRGGAVLAGFRQALVGETYAWFGEMDADQSHQPEELPSLIEASRRADLVIGARYLAGGRIEGWPFHRRIWSRTSNALIRRVLGVPMTDFTNGYRIYSRRAVEQLAAANLRETGYISLSEWAYVLDKAGMSIEQVPTVFINRRLGKSNMSAAEAIGAIRALLRMRGWLSGKSS